MASTHFSMYNVQVTENYFLSVEEYQEPLIDGFGPGWCWNIARIVETPYGKSLFLENGMNILCNWIKVEDEDGEKIITYTHHEGVYFKAVKNKEKGFLGVKKTTGYTVDMKDGTKYEFDKDGRLGKKSGWTIEIGSVLRFGILQFVIKFLFTMIRQTI